MTNNKLSTDTPRLRFLEHNEDPAWSKYKFSELYNFKSTNSLPRSKLNYENGLVRNIHYGDIHTEFKPLFRLSEENVPYITSNTFANEIDENAFCVEGDIILADASENIDDVGKAIEIISLDEELVVAGLHTILATRRGNVLVSGFGGQLFQSTAVRSGIMNVAQGTKVYGITASRISPVLIPIPPSIKEQTKIADCLSSLDELISATDQKLESLRKHRQGLLKQLFPKRGKTVPQIRFPEFRNVQGWKIKPLSSVCDINPSIKGLPELFIYINLTSVKSGMLLKRKLINRSAAPSSAQRLLSYKDIIFQTVRPYQRNNLFFEITDEHQYVASTGYAQLRAKKCPRFLYQLLHTDPFVYSVLARCTGSTYPVINHSELASIKVTFPEESEQKMISKCLKSIDDLIAASGQKLELLRKHKKGLLQQLFPVLKNKEQ